MGDVFRAAGREHESGAGVLADHGLRVEHGEEAVEITVAGGGEEGVDDSALRDHVGFGRRVAVTDPPPAAAGELPGRLGRTVQDGADLVERHRKHVVQHVRQPLGRGQRLEDDEQGEPDGIGQHGLMLRVGRGVLIVDRVGQPVLQGVLAPGPAGAEHVERDPPDHGDQPGLEVVDLVGVRAAEPEPRLLDRVIRLGAGAQHAEGDRPQPGPVLLKSFCQPFVLVHAL